MKTSLLNFKPLMLAVLLTLAAAPSLRAWTALELIPNGEEIPGYEAVHGNYVQRSLSQWSYGMMSAKVNPSNTSQIIIYGMFEGMVNAAFNITESGGKTYATLVTNSSGYYYTKNVGYGNTVAVNPQIRMSYDAYGVALYPCKVNIYGNYSLASTWKGEVTKDADGAISINFSTPICMYFTNSSNKFYDDEIFFNKYQVKLYTPNATAKDRYWVSDGSDLYSHDREYKAYVDFRDNNQFAIINWGGFGQGLKTTKVSSTPNAQTTFYVMEGYMTPETGKAYMKIQPWMQDILDVTSSTSNVYGAIGRYELRPVVESTVSQKNVTVYNRDVEGELTFGTPAHEDESDLWAAPYGNLRTTANINMSFEPFAAYCKEWKAIMNFRSENTIINCPEQDVTLALEHQALTLTPGTTSTNMLPVTATASFSAKRNDMFVSGFDVYLVEGSDPKGEKTIFLGSVAKNDDNFYSVTASFDLPSTDGRPWSEHVGDSYNNTYTLKVVANYNVSSLTDDALVTLSPTYHGLDSATLNFTVGVGGISTDGGIDVQATHGGVTVTAPEDMAVRIYNAAGSLVAEGRTNSEILLSGNGVYIVKTGAQVRKLIK